MRHENIQIDNLLRHTPKYSLSDLGLKFQPTFRVDVALELVNYIFGSLPQANIGLANGTIFQIKELLPFTSLKLLCIAGNGNIGNVVIVVNNKLRENELRVYRRYEEHIDIIRYLEFPSYLTTKVRGTIGQIYGLYKKQVNTVIQSGELDELEEISFIEYLHEYVLTGDLPFLLKEMMR